MLESFLLPDRVLSSAVEHFLHTEGATGSIPVAPTTFGYGLLQRKCLDSLAAQGQPALVVKKGTENKQALADQAKPVPLHVAASVIHQQLSGDARGWQGENYDAVLDSTALALSHISDIYYVNAQDQLLRIADEELAVGVFEGGAKRFRTRSGNSYEALSMRRADIADTIVILRNARGEPPKER